MSLRRYLTTLRDMRIERGEPVPLTPPLSALSLTYSREDERAARNVDREDASSPILAGEE